LDSTVTCPASEDTGPIAITVQPGSRGLDIVTLRGDLDIASASAVREHLLSLLHSGASRLVIDLSAIRYADASGLAALVSTHRRAVLLGGALRLAAPRPEVANVLAVTGISGHLEVYPTVPAALAGGTPASSAALLGAGPAVTAALVVPVQARAGRAADSGELRAAISALLASADAWRDADPRRRFSPALGALAQAYAGTSHAAMTKAAQSLLAVLGKEPLTYSPAVAVTASRLRGLFPPGPQRVMG
jgi:anti-anti-sigma factor